MAATASLLLIALSGCGSTTPSAQPSSSAASGTAPGSQLPAPVMLQFQRQPTSQATTTLGRMIVLVPDDTSTLADWTASTSPEGIVTFIAGGTKDQASFNPGLEPLQVGSTTVTVRNPANGAQYTVRVEVTAKP